MKQLKQDLDTSKLSKLTDDELKDEILDVNNKQLSIIGAMSYYYLIGKSGELIQLVNENNFPQKIKSRQEKEMLVTNFDYIINSFKKFHINMTKEDIEIEIEKLSDIRKELYDLSRDIEGYKIELSYVKELLDYYTMKVVGEKEYKNQEISNQEITLLINKISETLSYSTRDHFTFINVVSNILSIMPFRMSKSKYFDVLKNTIIRNFSYYPVELVESKIEDYKMLFDSSLSGNYGIAFDSYFTSIQRFRNIDIEDKPLDELEDVAEDIIELNLAINEIGVFINSLGVVINRLIVIYTLKKKNAFNNNNNIFLKWEEYQEKMDKNLLNHLKEITNNELNKLEKQLLKDIEVLKIFNEEELNRSEFFNENLKENLSFTNKILTYYNDTEFVEYNILFPQNNEIISSDYLEQLVDSLIQYVTRSISTMDNLERKVRMRRLLSVLELPFVNVEKFLSYVEYSLDERIVSKEEILFTIKAANYWLNGFLSGIKKGQ